MTVLLRVPALSWPAPADAGAEPAGRWVCYLLAVLADDHTATATAHHQLTDLLHTPLDPLPPDALADQLAAIAHTATTSHDHPHLHQLLNAHGHGHPDAVDHLRDAQRHRIHALQTLRRLADHARRGHTPTDLHTHLARARDDLDAAGAAITKADHTLIPQLKEVIDYSTQPQPPTHPQPTWGNSVSNTGEFRRAASLGCRQGTRSPTAPHRRRSRAPQRRHP